LMITDRVNPLELWKNSEIFSFCSLSPQSSIELIFFSRESCRVSLLNVDGSHEVKRPEVFPQSLEA
jgi:hypothetical protein